MSMPVITTRRLVLRPPSISDAEEVFARYAQDAEVTRYLSWKPHANLKDTRDFLQAYVAECESGKSAGWLIRSQSSDLLLGSIGMRYDGHRAELGYLIARDAWGWGYAAEAGRAVVELALALPHIQRVWAVCDVDNTRSARVLEKCGLEREGVLHRWTVFPNLGDRARDVFCYAKVK